MTVWQPRKLFFRVWGRAEQTADVYNPILDTNALRGVSYIDIASEALRKHRTQGMERANLRGGTRGRTMYKLMRENSLYDMDSTSFFSGIDVTRFPRKDPLRQAFSRHSPRLIPQPRLVCAQDPLTSVTAREVQVQAAC